MELLRRQYVLAVSRAAHAVAVCTGPHDSFESRHVVYDEMLDAAIEALQMQVVEQNRGVGVVGMAPQQPTTAVRTALGESLREYLVQCVQEKCLRACALRLRTLAIAHGANSSSSSSSVPNCACTPWYPCVACTNHIFIQVRISGDACIPSSTRAAHQTTS